LIIDRYKYLDLLPCNTAELKSMGYKDFKTSVSLSAASVMSASSLQSQPSKLSTTTNVNTLGEMTEANLIKSKIKYPIPDEQQMLPFKPVRNACKY
jgi:cleavage stimulation factor subunit 3